MRKLIEGLLAGVLVVSGCAQDNPSGLLNEGEGEGQAEAATKQTSALTLDDRARRFPCPIETPAALLAPAGNTLKSVFSARGMQIYTCSAATADAVPAWTLTAPHAVLSQGLELAAIHFAGPSWEDVDGSLVTGTKIASAPGPDATAIPWLLLQAATNVGAGLFSDVTWIQRLSTVGGVAPAGGCDADHLSTRVLVPYRADYFFYHAGT
jgi:Protein of unknown function (DUF3455)